MKKVVYLLAAAMIAGAGSFVFASQNPSEGELLPVRAVNKSRSDNSGYKYVKEIKAQSSMGTVERFDLYRDSDDNFCVKSRDNKRFISLDIYNNDGWSHKFVDGTTWYCNVYR